MRIHISTSPDLVFQRADDGSSVLFDPKADAVHALNPSATKVWDVLVEGGDEVSVRNVLAASLGRDVGEAAVYDTLAQFKKAGLVQTDADTLLVDNVSRRDTLRRLSLGLAVALALPVIETLTGSDQRAHTLHAQSEGPGGND